MLTPADSPNISSRKTSSTAATNTPSLDDFNKICNSLLSHHSPSHKSNSPLTSINISSTSSLSSSRQQTVIINSLAKIIEYVIYGDKKDEVFFLFFCEKQMMKVLLSILKTYHQQPLINIQILQTISILCQSVRSETSLYYLLSNNIINEIIMFPFQFDLDEDILPNYLSLLKSLSLILNATNIQLLIDDKTQTIPILVKSMELLHASISNDFNKEDGEEYSKQDSMIRIGAQVTILNILKIKNEMSLKIITSESILHELTTTIIAFLENCYREYYLALVNHIQKEEDETRHSTLSKQHSTLSETASSNDDTFSFTSQQHDTPSSEAESNALSSLSDWLYFLKDTFTLSIPKLSNKLLEAFISDYIYLTILEPFIQLKNSNINLLNFSSKTVPLTIYASCQVSFLFLNKIFQILPYEDVQLAVLTAIFHPLSRKERKRILFDYFSDSNSIKHSEIHESNLYRSIFIDIRQNQCIDRLYYGSCALLFWLSEGLLKQIQSRCGGNEDVNSCRSEDDDSSSNNDLKGLPNKVSETNLSIQVDPDNSDTVQYITTILYLFSTFHIFPWDNKFNRLLTHCCFPSNYSSFSSMASDPDMIQVSDYNPIEYMANYIPLTFNQESSNILYTIQNCLSRYNSSNSQQTIEYSLLTLLNILTCLKEFTDFLTELSSSIRKQYRIDDIEEFCDNVANYVIEIVENFYTVLRDAIRDAVLNDRRNSFINLMLVYHDTPNYKLNIIKENLINEKRILSYVYESDCSLLKYLRQIITIFYMTKDVMGYISNFIDSADCIGFSRLEEADNEDSLVLSGDIFDMTRSVNYLVKITTVNGEVILLNSDSDKSVNDCSSTSIESEPVALSRRPSIDKYQYYLCIESCIMTICSLCGIVILSIPILRAKFHVTDELPLPFSCSVSLSRYNQKAYPFLSTLLALKSSSSHGVVQFILSFENQTIRKAADQYITNVKDDIVNDILGIFIAGEEDSTWKSIG